VNSNTVPEALRQAVGNDLTPVRPLPPAWFRTVQATVVAAFGLAAVVLAFGLTLRYDLDQLPMWLGWGCTAVQLGIGVVLIGLALREAVPGQSVPPATLGAVVATGVLMQILVAIVTWMHSAGMPMPEGHSLAVGFGCAIHDSALAVPALAVTLWLVFRALPLRPSVAGLLGGTGAAVTADALNHVICPMSDLRHVLVWHTGALLGLMAVGWALGKAWELVTFRPDD
jgi:hypothetical protein